MLRKLDKESAVVFKANYFLQIYYSKSYFCNMIITDTHTHLYSEQFDEDRGEGGVSAVRYRTKGLNRHQGTQGGLPGTWLSGEIPERFQG